VRAQDPLYDFPPESMTVYGEPAATPSAWPVRTPLPDATDSTSRVISFVLGFALASLIAWLGSIRADRPVATQGSDTVATTVTPVVAGTTEETKDSQAEELPAVASLNAAAAAPPVTVPPPADRAPITPASVGPVPAAPLRVASAPVASLASVRTAQTRETPVEPAQPKTPPSAAVGYRGGLVLSSTPQGAEVVVNGQVVGQTPVVLDDLPVGSRALIVRRDGYSPWSTSVRIVANQRTTVQATLTPVP
jgi:hypothetical protein